MFKLDFHTHSILSPDGGISESDYEQILRLGKLDYIAITDHNEISFAQKLRQRFGERIIVGEEVMTAEGEVIGLFLTQKIMPGLSVRKTIEEIHTQKGLVYLPHPFDSLRNGIGKKAVLAHLAEIDILEGFNARVVLRWQNTTAREFAKEHKVPIGVGSDAHTVHGLGSAYAMIEKPLTRKNMRENLQHAKLVTKYQPYTAYFAPKLNRFFKRK